MPPLTMRKPRLGQRCRQRLGVGDNLLLIVGESGCSASFRQTALAAMMCISGPPWMPGNTARSRSLAISPGKRQPAARSAQRLVRGRGNEVGVRHRTGMKARGHEPAMCAMSTKKSAPTDLRDLRQAGEIDDARIGAGAGDDHLGLVLLGEAVELVVVDRLGFLADAVGNELVHLARKSLADARESDGRHAPGSCPAPCRQA